MLGKTSYKVYQVWIGQDVYRDKKSGLPICFDNRSDAISCMKALEFQVLQNKRENKRIHLVVIK